MSANFFLILDFRLCFMCLGVVERQKTQKGVKKHEKYGFSCAVSNAQKKNSVNYTIKGGRL